MCPEQVLEPGPRKGVRDSAQGHRVTLRQVDTEAQPPAPPPPSPRSRLGPCRAAQLREAQAAPQPRPRAHEAPRGRPRQLPSTWAHSSAEAAPGRTRRFLPASEVTLLNSRFSPVGGHTGLAAIRRQWPRSFPHATCCGLLLCPVRTPKLRLQAPRGWLSRTIGREVQARETQHKEHPGVPTSLCLWD